MIEQSLAGVWRFRLDPDEIGEKEAWALAALGDTIQLPGSTAERQKGPGNPEQAIAHLSERFPYVGKAWYQRDIEIPEAWVNKRLRLSFERSRVTRVWLDGLDCGSRNSLCAPHRYELGPVTPGTHRLTVCVDNKHLPIPGGHLTSPDTQTNWNGLLGRLALEAREAVSLEDVQLYPDGGGESVRIRFRLDNAGSEPVEAAWSVDVLNGPRVDEDGRLCSPDAEAAVLAHAELTLTAAPGESYHEAVCPMARRGEGWEEDQPVLYQARIRLDAPGSRDEFSDVFGFRRFEAAGTQFAVNGRTVFLRGKHDGLVFPLTGYAPMDTEAWLHTLSVAKSFGINHYRFHTCCPPDAAFRAADLLGVYMAPELPFWGAWEETDEEGRFAYLREEAFRILAAYGNHPSFVMFGLGNELHGSREAMAGLLHDLRQRDGRQLYSDGANNFFWAPEREEAADYWVTMRTAQGPVRASFSHADPPLGHVQSGPPSTQTDYRDSLAGVPMPVIGHEIGQYQAYPDFREIDRYTGVLEARNFTVFRERLAERGMLDQAAAFTEASGKLAELCYREEIEAALRTPGLGGFQLLDLQDFPGQGTALVGVLNAFMEPKPFLDAERWRQFCAPTVLLARFPSYVATAGDAFSAELELAHYGRGDWPAVHVRWTLTENGESILGGETAPVAVRQGSLAGLGRLEFKLPDRDEPARFDLELFCPETGTATAYPLWIYPPAEPEKETEKEAAVCRTVEEALRVLEKGGRALLIPDLNEAQPAATVPGFFASDFWSYPMFRAICESRDVPVAPGTLGLLCDPQHPALREFPTEFHSNWQWWTILENSAALVMDSLPAEVRPVVQVIDNFERNHRLGLLLEARVGEGKLLVCMSDLPACADRPEARQLLRSLSRYVASDEFEPAHALTPQALAALLDPQQDGLDDTRRDAVHNPSYFN